MKIGFLGLGKLGHVLAYAVAYKGHEVIGYDPFVKSKADFKEVEAGPNGEPKGFEDILRKYDITYAENMQQVVNNAEIIIVLVQTPHDPTKYEGITRVPETRDDFDYKYLVKCMDDLKACTFNDTKVIYIASTVLPGTIRREIIKEDKLHSKCRLVYGPAFPAMGTAMYDFLNPEFILLGTYDDFATQKVKEFYKTITDKPVREMSIESAELCKVAYNTYITSKIVFANTLMEICHKTHANLEDVTNTLKLATNRLISPKYLSGGMGDSGGCHPRDLIAFSHIARQLCLSHNIFDDYIKARESQTEWLADIIVSHANVFALPVVILGKAFKENIKLTIGSCAVLLASILKEKYKLPFCHYDPYVDSEVPNGLFATPKIYFIATKHDCFKTFQFPDESVIVDPFRYMPDKEGITVVRLGENKT